MGTVTEEATQTSRTGGGCILITIDTNCKVRPLNSISTLKQNNRKQKSIKIKQPEHEKKFAQQTFDCVNFFLFFFLYLISKVALIGNRIRDEPSESRPETLNVAVMNYRLRLSDGYFVMK